MSATSSRTRRRRLAEMRRRRRRRLLPLLLTLTLVIVVGSAWVAHSHSALAAQGQADAEQTSGATSPTSSTTKPAAPTTGSVPTSSTSLATGETKDPDSSAADLSTTGAATTTTAPAAGEPALLIDHVQTDRKLIALTFDDNYQTDRSYSILQTLKQYDVPATCFVIGHYTETGPDFAKAITQAGLEVGDHTYSHTDCSSAPERWLPEEIGGGTDAFRKVTGAHTSRLFRPPYGYYNDATLSVAGQKGFTYAVTWDIDTRDWEGKSADEIKATVLDEAHPGAIVLMHFNAPHSYEALPGIIEGLRALGYEMVTVSDLIQNS